jgi:L-threonylcarbamoyladenylate synthase
VIDEAVAAIREGEPVILPTDTVYGLCTNPAEEPVRRLYRLKGRRDLQPTALVATDVDAVVEAIPEIEGQSLLHGPYTLIVANPARRFPWLAGDRPDTIGVRIPVMPGGAAEVLRAVGIVAATSANRPGEQDPRTVDDVPEEFRAAAGAVVDEGPLPGTPSTVIDLTGREPVVLREGLVAAAEALERLRALVR